MNSGGRLVADEQILGVVPARGGSKRIPRKNLREVGGKTLIRRTAEAATASVLLDRVIVTTDDHEIADEARQCGLEVPFLRPAHLGTDEVPDQPVVRHAVEHVETEDGWRPSIVVLLRPTTPFRGSGTIDAAIRLLCDRDADVVRTVTPAQGIGHPCWTLREDDDGWAVPFIEGLDLCRYHQSQALPAAHHLNGVVDVMRRTVVDRPGYLSNTKTALLSTDEQESFDIDTPFDLLICDLLARSPRGVG